MRSLWIRGAVVLGIAIAGPGATLASQVVSSGHADVSVWYEDGRYELKLSSGGDWKAEPENFLIVVPPTAHEGLSGGVAAVGAGLSRSHGMWKLSQSSFEAAQDQTVWLGLQVHGGYLTPGGGTGSSSGGGGGGAGNIELRLRLAGASGPGQFFMWQDLAPNALGAGGPGGPGFESRQDLLSEPGLPMNSGSNGGFVELWGAAHTHVNWGFTKPGNYAVTFQLTGHDSQGTYIDDTATYNFDVQASSAQRGDLNDDGVVDRADMLALVSNFGRRTGASAEQGDLNADGAVSLLDLLALQGGFAGHPGVASPAAVPEPSTIVLTFGIGIAVAWGHYRRRR